MSARPGADDRWRAKKAHYQDPEVVARYDAQRFRTRHQRTSTERKWRAITSAMGDEFAHVRRVLDVPCGTGRFTQRFLHAEKELVNADISQPMLASARAVAAATARPFAHVHPSAMPGDPRTSAPLGDRPARAGEIQRERSRDDPFAAWSAGARAPSEATPLASSSERTPDASNAARSERQNAPRGAAAPIGRLVGSVRCDAEHLPFADAAFDLVLSIRFLFHAPPDARVRMLREYARVSRRWVVVDLRHGYSVAGIGRYLWAALRRKPSTHVRPSPSALSSEIASAGLSITRRVFLSRPFSEKLIVVCERKRAR